jgi:hypothetical protein
MIIVAPVCPQLHPIILTTAIVHTRQPGLVELGGSLAASSVCLSTPSDVSCARLASLAINVTANQTGRLNLQPNQNILLALGSHLACR